MKSVIQFIVGLAILLFWLPFCCLMAGIHGEFDHQRAA